MSPTRHIHKSTLIKGAATVILLAMLLAVFFGIAGVFINWLAARDAKLMALHDQQLDAKLAKQCGKRGTLVRDGTTGGHACMYVNQDGQAVFAAVHSHPVIASAQ